MMDGLAPSPPASLPQSAAGALDAMLAELGAFAAVVDAWDPVMRAAADAHAAAIDRLNAEAFRRLIRGLRDIPDGAAALRAAAGDDVVYAVLRRHGILKPSLFERVESALGTIRPMLASHGGNVELVRVELPLAEVRFIGACESCPASAMTFYAGVKKAIGEHVPEITDIRQVKGFGGGNAETVHFTSPFAAGEADGWLSGGTLGELPDGETRFITVGEHAVILSRFGDTVTCFENACAHMGLPMDGGELAAGHLTCPYHGFRYALMSGECLTAPEVQLQAHAVRVVGDRVEIRLAR